MHVTGMWRFRLELQPGIPPYFVTFIRERVSICGKK